jgi:hypothetical protein
VRFFGRDGGAWVLVQFASAEGDIMKRISRAFIAGLSIGAICLCATPCLAADTETIDTVSDDGSTVIMQSGQTYDSDDPGTSASWQSGDNVVITDSDKIINTDDNGDSVEGTEE